MAAVDARYSLDIADVGMMAVQSLRGAVAIETPVRKSAPPHIVPARRI